MTELTRPVSRKITDARRGQLIVTLAPEGVYVRRPRARTLYGPVSYGLIALRGEQMAAEEIRRAKRSRRRAGK